MTFNDSRLWNRKFLICIVTGFSSGLPLYLLLNLLPAWLHSAGVSLATISLSALTQLPYTWKFVWSPLLDRYSPLGLGRRRGWALLTGALLFFAIGALGAIPAKENIELALWLAGGIAFLSSTQDIALDAYRREILDEAELGLGNAFHVNAYRIAGLVPGSLSLILADILPWEKVFWITALFMLPGVFMMLFVREPSVSTPRPKTLQAAIVEPFLEFIRRAGWKDALCVLGFIFLYKLGDSLCTALATPFYLSMGFSKTDIGLVAKHAGLWPAVIGGIVGGVWMLRLGINRALWVFGFVQLVSIFGFAWLASHGPYLEINQSAYIALASVIGIEALGVGLGTAAFVAFIARATHPAYTATQFALFTSLAAVPRTFINASAGWLINALGWYTFFLLCALLAVPGMLLLFYVAPWTSKETPQQ